MILAVEFFEGIEGNFSPPDSLAMRGVEFCDRQRVQDSFCLPKRKKAPNFYKNFGDY